MSQAAKWFDVVLGVDVHMVMAPGAGAVPMPHVFTGYVFDPASAVMSKLTGGALVYVNGIPAAGTGTAVRALFKHVPTPPGISFAPNDIPGNEGSIVMGSKTVSFGGSSAARQGSRVTTCNFPVNMPTSTCMAVAAGAPVLVGGPDSMDWMAAVTQGIRTKWVSNALHKLLKPGKFLSWLICTLTGHPVDVMTGRVLAHTVDFELAGPIPLVFERNYDSRDRYEGPLGPAWHHPLDVSVNEYHKFQPLLEVRLPDGRRSPHDALAAGDSVWDPIDRYTLLRTKTGYRLTFWNGLAYHFEPVPGAHVTHPLVKITDRCDNTIELHYRDGRLAQVVDSGGRRLDFETKDGRLRAVRLRCRDGSPIDLVRYEYDAEGRLAAAIDPAGQMCRYAYKGGVMVKETNRNGLSFYFEYQWHDPDGWCVHTWGDGGIYDRRITYDEINHVTLVDDTRGGRTHYYGNPAGLVNREVDPMGVEKRYEWHPHQYQKTAEIDGLGNRTEWAYDARGNLVRERDPLGHETRWTYNELNVSVEQIEAAGGVWKRDYDSRGKLVREINPLGEVTRCKHGRQGNLASVEDARGRRVTFRYTPGGELGEMTSAEGHVTAFEVDDRGLPVKRIDALGGETRLERDACGRVSTLTRPDGSVLRRAYDPEGNLVEHTDALGNVARFRYEGLDKLAASIDPAGGEVQYLRDREEDLIGVINEAGERYTIERDVAGRVVKEHGFDGRRLELWYDAAGRCREMVDAQEKRTKIERDACGRMVKRIVPRPPVLGDPIPAGEPYEYAYDALGGLLSAKNDTCAVTFARDALGRVVEERCDGITVTSRYDASGDRVGRSTSLGHAVTYDFDGDGGLLGVSLDAGPLWGAFDAETLALGAASRKPWQATFRRNALGNEVERTLPGGVVSRWKRDIMGLPRMQSISHNAAQVGKVGYRWRSAEQIAALIDTAAGPTWFEHDARGYLISATPPDKPTQHRAPDAVGNIFRSPARDDRTYARGGRIEKVGDVCYVHNADGQLVQKMLSDGRSWNYGWDLAGQLVEVIRPDGERVTFAYDALGRRLRKSFGGETTRYVWDAGDLVHEVLDGEGLVSWVCEPGTFAPLAKEENKKRYGIVTDHLGTPRMLADEEGALAWKAQLDVYGTAQNEVAETTCPWRWPGQYEDEETGLYYNRFRYYDPETGRYVSQDPIGLAGGVNLYAYVPDPLLWIDPLGLAFGLYEFIEVGGTYIGSSVDTFRRLGQHMSDNNRLLGRNAAVVIAVDVSGATGRDAIRLLRLAEQEAIDMAGKLGRPLTNQIDAVAQRRMPFHKALRDWYENGQNGPKPPCK